MWSCIWFHLLLLHFSLVFGMPKIPKIKTDRLRAQSTAWHALPSRFISVWFWLLCGHHSALITVAGRTGFWVGSGVLMQNYSRLCSRLPSSSWPTNRQINFPPQFLSLTVTSICGFDQSDFKVDILASAQKWRGSRRGHRNGPGCQGQKTRLIDRGRTSSRQADIKIKNYSSITCQPLLIVIATSALRQIWTVATTLIWAPRIQSRGQPTTRQTYIINSIMQQVLLFLRPAPHV